MAYDEGLEVRFGGRRYTAFFKYGFNATRDMPFVSFCHETRSGWTFHDRLRLPGCRAIEGRRVGAGPSNSSHKTSAQGAIPASSMASHAATFESSDGKTDWRQVASSQGQGQGSSGRQAHFTPVLQALLLQQKQVLRSKALQSKAGEVGNSQGSQAEVRHVIGQMAQEGGRAQEQSLNPKP